MSTSNNKQIFIILGYYEFTTKDQTILHQKKISWAPKNETNIWTLLNSDKIHEIFNSWLVSEIGYHPITAEKELSKLIYRMINVLNNGYVNPFVRKDHDGYYLKFIVRNWRKRENPDERF